MSSGPSETWSVRRALRMTRSILLCFDAGAPDQRPPFFNLGLVKSGERLGRLLLARRDLLAKVGEALAHRRVVQRIHGGRREFVNDLRRRAARHPQAVPGGDIDAGRAGLV